MDECEIVSNFSASDIDATLKTITCAIENTILIKLSITWPGASVSADLRAIEGNGAVCSVKKALAFSC